MEQEDQLFALIKSLSKAEKRYFTLDASRYSAKKEKNYLKLFRIFDEQEVYDAAQIKAKLKGLKMAGNLALEKHQLYEHILDSLGRFHAEASVVNKLVCDLKLVDILKSKELSEQARKILARAKKTCYEQELFELLMQVISMQMKLLDPAENDYEKLFNEYIAERSEAWGKLRNIDEVQCKRVYLGQLQGDIGSPQNERELALYLSFYDDFISLEQGLLTVTARNIYYRALSLYYNLLLDYKSARKYNQLRYELYESNPWMVDNEPREYVIFLFFYIQNQVALGEFDDALLMIRKLERLREEYRQHTNPETFTEIERRLVPLSVYVNGHLENYDAIIAMKDELKKFLVNHGNDLPVFRRNGFIYNVAQTFFLIGNHRECHRWLMESVQDPDARDDYESYYFISLLLIINSCQLQSWDLAESHVLSLKRYVRQREKDNTIALDLLTMLGRYIRNDSKEERRKELKAFTEINSDWLKAYLGEHVFLSRWWNEHNVSI